MTSFHSNSNRTLYLDCSSGISGDMMVAALLDLGADAKVLLTALSSLPLDGYRIEIRNVIKSGLRACDFNVILDQSIENHDHDMEYLHGSPDISHCRPEYPHEPSSSRSPHSHKAYLHQDSSQLSSSRPDAFVSSSHGMPDDPAQTASAIPSNEAALLREKETSYEQQSLSGSQDLHHEHHHHGHGRNLKDVISILSSGKLSPRALELAMKIFRIVAEAESQVHGKPLDEVHFHEVGAVDSIVDIAAVAVCVDNLNIERVILTSLTEGRGQVRCQHGLLPIPVPATTAILSAHQLPLHISNIQGELVTPTGAAIAAALRTDSQLPGEFRILRTGLGAGKRNYQTTGILRAMLIEETGMENDTILILETNMDDCSGEAMGFVMEELLAAGALDVFYTPIYMKKHRPAYQLSVLCPSDRRKDMEALIFRHTTTIGLRVYEARRTKLSRKIISLETPWGMADIKCCQFDDETYYYPESDSIQQLAKNNQLSYTEMYHEVKNYAAKNHPIL